MTVSQETLTVQNAPRDPELLASKGAYKLRKLAQELGLLNEQQHKSAFINGKPGEMAQVVAAGLRAWDTQHGGNGAAPQVAMQPVASAVATPPPSVLGPAVSIPTTAGPVTTAAAPTTEGPAATGRKPRSPQPVEGAAEGLLKEIKTAIETHGAAIDALAKTVVGTKTLAEHGFGALGAPLNAILQTQQITLSLLLILAENQLGAGQGDLANDARGNVTNFPQLFPGKV